MTCKYCGGAKRFQITSPVSDGAWAACFCRRPAQDSCLSDAPRVSSGACSLEEHKMPRSTLSELKATLSDLHDLEMTAMPASDWLILRNEAGDILFSIKAEDICDADGKRFEDDLL